MSEPAVIEERVYVGNVDFNATEEELQALFEGLNIVSVEIPSKKITRGKKSFVKRLGFGFVQFASKEDADQAIEDYNNKEFKGRQIYVKKALPPATEDEKKEKTEAYFAKQKELRAAKAKKKKDALKAANAGESAEVAEGTERNGDSDGSKHQNNGEAKVQDASKTPDGNKSKDTVFITNLDYKANAKVLSQLFSDLNPVWIHVPRRRVAFHVLKRYQAKKRPIFNKGIAFAKFADEETQLKAISEFNGKEINERNIIVEAAVDREVSSAEKASLAESSTPAEGTDSADGTDTS